MNIIWRYLDKRSATIAAVKDYDAMKFIIDNTDDEVLEVRDKMTGVGSPNWDGMPHAHNPSAGEDRILKGIEEIDILKERYRQAVEYMEWFQPAWDELSEDEQYVLEVFYQDENSYGSYAAETVAEHFGNEHTSAHKKKNRALDHLTVLLFGKA